MFIHYSGTVTFCSPHGLSYRPIKSDIFISKRNCPPPDVIIHLFDSQDVITYFQGKIIVTFRP